MTRGVAALATLITLSGCVVGSGGTIRPQDQTLVDAGAELYSANCAQCHGDDLRGTDKGPSHLSVIYEPSHHGDGAFLVAVTRGVRAHHWDFGDMPPVEGLTADDVEAIVAFVRETQRVEGFDP